MFDSEYSTEDGLKQVMAQNVRRARIARRLSLSELARVTGLGKATLSQIEAARANPTVETLRLLAEALEVRVAELVDEPAAGEVRVVRRPREEPAAAPARRAIDRFGADGAVDVLELQLPARHHEEMAPEPGGAREELYVVHGMLVAGPAERPTELGPGDWASFPADVARVLATGRSAVRALVLSHA